MSAADRTESCCATEGLIAGYVPEVDILTGVSIDGARGRDRDHVGPNGAGKSTLIKTIFGLLRPRSGPVVFRGEDLTGRKPHDITRLGLSYVPQLDNVFQSLTVEENLEMGSLDRSTHRRADRARCTSSSRGSASGARQAAGTMSGGERQMVAMARALMPDPQVLLLDEPSAGLAPAFVDAIFEKIAGDQPRRRDDRDGRAERPPGARDVGPRLRARPRPEPLRGSAARSCSTTRRSPSSTSAAPPGSTGPDEPQSETAGALGPGRPLANLRLAGCSATGWPVSTGVSPITSRVRSPLYCVDVVDAGGRVAVLVHVDRPGRALVVDVVAVLAAP